MVVKEIQTGDETYPDYKMSMFRPEATSLPIYFKDKAVFKNAPLNADGKIEASVQAKIKDFLLDREVSLEDFSPKPLNEEQQSKITEISNFLTGKASTSYSNNKTESKPSSDDFDFEDNFSAPATSSASEEEDDFFSDL
jgi:hypothetical protein